MVELTEYLLAFTVSSVLAASGLAVMQGAMPLVRETASGAAFNQVAESIALAALSGRTEEVVVPLTNASLGCAAGVLSFSEGAARYSSSVGAQCSFSVSGLSCVCRLVFLQSRSGVTMEVQR